MLNVKRKAGEVRGEKQESLVNVECSIRHGG